jgi:hypothetical protein
VAILTGANGALQWNCQTVARCRSWSITISRDMLDDTPLNAYDRTYIEGLRGANGTAVILYDPANASANEIMDRILTNGGIADPLGLILSTTTMKTVSCYAFINQASIVKAVREATAVSLSFTVSGLIYDPLSDT